MYIPRHFQQQDTDAVLAFISAYSFGLIVSAGDHQPIATHLPFVPIYENENLVLVSHLAKANPQATFFDKRVLVVFQEPHAYISPTNYLKTDNVPTWNYISVHTYGRVEVVTDKAEGVEILEKMIHFYEKNYQKQWETEVSDSYKEALFAGIIPFRVKIDTIQMAEKLSQNKQKDEINHIIADLTHQPSPVAQSLGRIMQQKYTSK